MKPRAIILCDFDGVVTTKDVCDEIMGACCRADWQAIGKLYENGGISHENMNEKFASLLDGDGEKIKKYVEGNITLRSGFTDLLRLAYRKEIGFVLLSGGWDLYIEAVLKDFDLFFPEEIEGVLGHLNHLRQIIVVCNRLAVSNGRFVFTPHSVRGKACTPDKVQIASTLKNNFEVPIICIGDGHTDYALAEMADHVFAIGGLSSYCDHKKIRFFPFQTLGDVCAKINQLNI